jgi:hypothetical protein
MAEGNQHGLLARLRGHVEVVDDMLYLKRVDLGNFEKPKHLTPRLFPGKKPPIPAD